jgi:hypothetical protein
MNEPKSPLADLAADTEHERDDSRRRGERARELLGRVLNENEVEDHLSHDLREAIERELAS